MAFPQDSCAVSTCAAGRGHLKIFTRQQITVQPPKDERREDGKKNVQDQRNQVCGDQNTQKPKRILQSRPQSLGRGRG
jgi:hypothetical protein